MRTRRRLSTSGAFFQEPDGSSWRVGSGRSGCTPSSARTGSPLRSPCGAAALPAMVTKRSSERPRLTKGPCWRVSHVYFDGREALRCSLEPLEATPSTHLLWDEASPEQVLALLRNLSQGSLRSARWWAESLVSPPRGDLAFFAKPVGLRAAHGWTDAWHAPALRRPQVGVHDYGAGAFRGAASPRARLVGAAFLGRGQRGPPPRRARRRVSRQRLRRAGLRGFLPPRRRRGRCQGVRASRGSCAAPRPIGGRSRPRSSLSGV